MGNIHFLLPRTKINSSILFNGGREITKGQTLTNGGPIKEVRGRNGLVIDFNKQKIFGSVFRVVKNLNAAKDLSDKVVRILELKYQAKPPTLMDIRHVVNEVLIEYTIQRPIRRRLNHPPRGERYIRGTRMVWSFEYNGWIDPDAHGPPGARYRPAVYRDRTSSKLHNMWRKQEQLEELRRKYGGFCAAGGKALKYEELEAIDNHYSLKEGDSLAEELVSKGYLFREAMERKKFFFFTELRNRYELTKKGESVNSYTSFLKLLAGSRISWLL